MMNNIIKVDVNNVITMSSLEIAELTGKQHRNVTVDIEKMLSDLNLPTAEFSAVYKADNNQEYRCFNLPKRETLILVSGYSVALRAKIIDRWQELEARDNKPLLPQNYEEALEHLLVQVKENRLLVEENKQLETNLADTQAVVDEYEDRLPDEWERNLRQVAKLIEVKSNRFNQRLLDYGYIYKNRGIYYGRKYYVERGWFKTKHFSDNCGNFRDSFVVTNIGYKGLTRHIAQGKINVSDIRI